LRHHAPGFDLFGLDRLVNMAVLACMSELRIAEAA
jgi:hypothetical protein